MNLESILFSVIAFLLFVLFDLIAPIAIDKPSFSVTAWVGRTIEQQLIQPVIRKLLFSWYRRQYIQCDRDAQYYWKQHLDAPAEQKAYYRYEAAQATRRRVIAHQKLMEVRDVQSS